MRPRARGSSAAASLLRILPSRAPTATPRRAPCARRPQFCPSDAAFDLYADELGFADQPKTRAAPGRSATSQLLDKAAADPALRAVSAMSRAAARGPLWLQVLRRRLNPDPACPPTRPRHQPTTNTRRAQPPLPPQQLLRPSHATARSLPTAWYEGVHPLAHQCTAPC